VGPTCPSDTHTPRRPSRKPVTSEHPLPAPSPGTNSALSTASTLAEPNWPEVPTHALATAVHALTWFSPYVRNSPPSTTTTPAGDVLYRKGLDAFHTTPNTW
jgi:hypothetical protein